MTPLHKQFAILVGKILARRWFNEQRQRAERNTQDPENKDNKSAPPAGAVPENRKKQD